MKTYTFGIMGLGKIAEAFASAVNATENTALVCASRTVEKAKSFAEKYSAKRYYGSYKQLAYDTEVDIIYIATPMSCHYEDVKLCLEGGRNVICEKSVTMNAEQWKELTAEAKDKGLFLMEAMWMKCLPAFRKAKDWIAQGKIGKPVYVKADLNSLCVDDGKDRLYRKDLGGGSLLDLGVYVLTLACDILGYKPDEIHSAMRISETGVDFMNAMLLKYKDGSFADLTSAFDFLMENRAYIVGTSGKIIFEPWFHCTQFATLYDAKSNQVERFDGSFICNGYEYEVMEAVRCLESGKLESVLVPQSETLAVMEIMDEIRKQ